MGLPKSGVEEISAIRGKKNTQKYFSKKITQFVLKYQTRCFKFVSRKRLTACIEFDKNLIFKNLKQKSFKISTAMNWNFIKTNWFYLAMGIVLVLYTVRKYPRLNPFNSSGKNSQTEKITEGKGARKGGEALLGFVPETPKERSPEMSEVSAAKTEAFLKRFAQVAVSEHKKFGTPSSIILACAYSNSQAGQRETATAANNFFALPCGDGWENETAQIGGQCVRKYESAWASFRDFSIYLSSQEWFGSFKKSAGKDWRKWAEKFGSEGVGNAKAMQQVIEAYRLEELD